MNIEWVNCILGGVILGCVSALYLIFNKQALSITGILSRLFEKKLSKNWNNDILFLIGLIMAPIIHSYWINPIEPLHISSNPYLLSFSGLSIGVGLQMIKGFTVTHVISGLSKLSKESFFIITIIIISGFLVQNLFHALGLS